MPRATSKPKYRYRGFISYSTRDKRWASRLHRALESYQIPEGIEVETDRNDQNRRLGKFFRDDDELSAVEALGPALEGAIDDSESLIVVCSPHSARSEWVDREVRHFKRDPDRKVFAVIFDGEPHAKDPAKECFCPALKQGVDVNGELTGDPAEPLAPNLQEEGLQRTKTRLAAGLLNVAFDELWNRERRRKRERTLRNGTAVALIALISVWAVVSSIRSADIRRVREPALAAHQNALEAQSKAQVAHKEAARIATLTKANGDSPAPAGIKYEMMGYAGGITYRGSRTEPDNRWIHVQIRYLYGGSLYSGEIPWTDSGEFVNQGGAEETKYGIYFYAPNAYYEWEADRRDAPPETDGAHPLGDYYEGEFVDGDPDGYGVYIFEDGRVYSGQFSKDAIDGYGILEEPSGRRWVGQWTRNRSVEPGYIESPDGNISFQDFEGLTLHKRSPAITPE